MTEVSKKTIPELEAMIREKQETLRKFRFDIAGSKIRNTKLGRNTRKDIARAKTELKAKVVSK